jgi:hypothetical protein
VKYPFILSAAVCGGSLKKDSFVAVAFNGLIALCVFLKSEIVLDTLLY